MTPREFLNRFGLPTFHVHQADGVNNCVIPPDPDRYLLCFWSITGMATIFPTGQYDVTPLGQSFGGNSRPIRLTHPLDGALVNLGWTVTNVSFGSVFTWLEGRMTGSVEPIQTAVPIGQPIESVPRSVSQQLPPSMVVPPEVFMPPTTFPTVSPPVETGRTQFFIRSAPPVMDDEQRMYLQQGYNVIYVPGTGWYAVQVGHVYDPRRG